MLERKLLNWAGRGDFQVPFCTFQGTPETQLLSGGPVHPPAARESSGTRQRALADTATIHLPTKITADIRE